MSCCFSCLAIKILVVPSYMCYRVKSVCSKQQRTDNVGEGGHNESEIIRYPLFLLGKYTVYRSKIGV